MTSRRCAAALLGLALVLSAGAATAGERRIALLVANPFGGGDLQPLRYTANDVERMREVLTGFGSFAAGDVLVSYGEDADAVIERFDEVQARVAAAQARGESTLFLFYYSGHAKDGELRLGDSRLALAEVKRMTEASGATLRLAVIDACRSGSITRLKGATKGEPITVGVDDAAAQTGLVFITASSEAEDAQESDDVQGSFFTYFLSSGLRGAADQSGDGEVSLSEAYNHAYNATVLATVGTRGGVQHPTYRFDLRGAGDVVLTDLRGGASGLVFPAGVTGEFVVFDPARRVVVAELDKGEARPYAVALAPGSYVVKKREPDFLRIGRFTVVPGATTAVDLAAMQRVAFADDYAKGAVITVGDMRTPPSGVRIGAGLLAQTFLSAPARREYFPNMALAAVQVDFPALLSQRLGLRIDAGFGSSGNDTLVLQDPYLGQARYGIRVSEVTAGAALVTAYEPRSWLRLAGQVRLGGIYIDRRFSDVLVPHQSFSTLTPGLGGEADIRLASWLTAGLALRGHYVFFNVDQPQSLAYIDGGFFLTVVLR